MGMLELIPDRPDEGTLPLLAAARQVLDAIGQRLTAARAGEAGELERLAAFLRIAEDVGLRQNEIAERAGVSRQTLINLRNSDRGLGQAMPLDTQLMMAAVTPSRHDHLVERFARGPVDAYEVEEALARLERAGAIRIAALLPEAATTIAVYRLTGSGTAELPGRLHYGARPPSMTWTAYVSASQAEVDAIVASGEEALGQEQVMVIPAGTVHGMELPEVAFYVEAPANDFNAAAVAASNRYQQLRHRTGLPPLHESVRISTLIPPDGRTSSHGLVDEIAVMEAPDEP
jgi:transcriptional regulator with XRE-family HTH domain